jgi:hypothetical protein
MVVVIYGGVFIAFSDSNNQVLEKCFPDHFEPILELELKQPRKCNENAHLRHIYNKIYKNGIHK